MASALIDMRSKKRYPVESRRIDQTEHTPTHSSAADSPRRRFPLLPQLHLTEPIRDELTLELARSNPQWKPPLLVNPEQRFGIAVFVVPGFRRANPVALALAQSKPVGQFVGLLFHPVMIVIEQRFAIVRASGVSVNSPPVCLINCSERS